MWQSTLRRSDNSLSVPGSRCGSPPRPRQGRRATTKVGGTVPRWADARPKIDKQGTRPVAAQRPAGQGRPHDVPRARREAEPTTGRSSDIEHMRLNREEWRSIRCCRREVVIMIGARLSVVLSSGRASLIEPVREITRREPPGERRGSEAHRSRTCGTSRRSGCRRSVETDGGTAGGRSCRSAPTCGRCPPATPRRRGR